MKHRRRRLITKTELIARLHRGLRPKLVADQRTDLGLVHINNLDLISRGGADSALLWDVVATAFTWSKVAELLDVGVPEMAEQLEVTARLVERYNRTGRVAFDGTDYQLAKQGLDVMDQLASIVDRATAIASADWSEAQVNALASASTAQQSRTAACPPT